MARNEGNVFLRSTNEFFDMLNGSHSREAARKNNPNLRSYDVPEDPRFQKLNEFLKYLDDWKQEVEALPVKKKMSFLRKKIKHVCF